MDVASTNEDSQQSFVDGMAERVRTLAGARGMSQAALARAIGINPQTLTNYWKGHRPYPAELVPRLAAALSTTVDYISGVVTIEEELDLVRVEEVDLAYGLGGTFIDDLAEVRSHHFPRAWIKAITSTAPSLLFIARGRGDSMMPTLLDGDMIIVDRSQRSVREQDAIWALTVGEIAMIKRLRVRGEQVQILSDNDRVPPDDANVEDVNIVGRVIFIGRRL